MPLSFLFSFGISVSPFVNRYYFYLVGLCLVCYFFHLVGLCLVLYYFHLVGLSPPLGRLVFHSLHLDLVDLRPTTLKQYFTSKDCEQSLLELELNTITENN